MHPTCEGLPRPAAERLATILDDAGLHDLALDVPDLLSRPLAILVSRLKLHGRADLAERAEAGEWDPENDELEDDDTAEEDEDEWPYDDDDDWDEEWLCDDPEHEEALEELGELRHSVIPKLLGTIRFIAQTVHQAHHEGPQETCPKSTCDAARTVLGETGRTAVPDSRRAREKERVTDEARTGVL